MVFLKEELTIFLSFIAKYSTKLSTIKKSHFVCWRLSIRDITLNAFSIVAAKKSLDLTAEQGGTPPPLLNL